MVHNLKRGKCQILALRGHHNYLRTWDCHDDVVYTASQDETAKVWDLRTRVGATFSGHVGPVTGIQPVAPPPTLASVPSGRNLGDAQRASARRNTGMTGRRTDKRRKAMAATRKYVVTGSMGRCVARPRVLAARSQCNGLCVLQIAPFGCGPMASGKRLGTNVPFAATEALSRAWSCWSLRESLS